MIGDSGSKVRPTRKLLLASWFRDLRAPLRRFLGRRLRFASADLDDVAQEVYLRLLRYDRVELIEDPQAYLFRIAANVASEWSMRARARLPHAACWLDDLVDDFDALHDTERAELEAEVRTAVEELSPRTQEILRLRFAEGLSNEGAARRLGVTHRVIRRELVQAYACLRLRLAPLQGSEHELT